MNADAPLEALLSSDVSADEVWPRVIRRLREQSASPDDWRAAWDRTFASWDETSRGPRPMWYPTAADRDQSNLCHFMRATGHGSYQDLYQWSVTQPNEFWQAVADQLNIVFDQPPQRTLDLTRGVTQPAWFPGATLNIVESCFPAPFDNQPALVWGDAQGERVPRTYGELKDEVMRVASALAGVGFAPGDRIAIVMPMTPEAVAIYLGIIFAGCVAVSIADSFAAPEIAKRLTIAEARGVFCVDSFQRTGRAINIYHRLVAAEALAPSCWTWKRAHSFVRGTKRGRTFGPRERLGQNHFSSSHMTPSTSCFRRARRATPKRSLGIKQRPLNRHRMVSFITIFGRVTWWSGRPTWGG